MIVIIIEAKSNINKGVGMLSKIILASILICYWKYFIGGWMVREIWMCLFHYITDTPTKLYFWRQCGNRSFTYCTKTNFSFFNRVIQFYIFYLCSVLLQLHITLLTFHSQLHFCLYAYLNFSLNTFGKVIIYHVILLLHLHCSWLQNSEIFLINF